MKRPTGLALFAFLLLPGCLDAVVGAQRTDAAAVCCSIDGGYDVGALDFAAGEAGGEEAGTILARDTGKSLDLGTSLDEGSDAGPSTLDAPADLRMDKMTADLQDGRARDASDAPLDKASDAPVDLRETAVTDTRDSAAKDALAVRDVAKDPGRSDSGGNDSACHGCADAKDTADLAPATNDAADVPGVRLDVATADRRARGPDLVP